MEPLRVTLQESSVVPGCGFPENDFSESGFVKGLRGAGADRWDDHGASGDLMPVHCNEVDQPEAGLLKDLKAQGLLDSTLVVWATAEEVLV